MDSTQRKSAKVSRKPEKPVRGIMNPAEADLLKSEEFLLEGLKPFEEIPCTQDGQSVDYYHVLGLSNQATRAEIRQARKILSQVYHPDSRRRMLASYSSRPGFEEDCDRILLLIYEAKDVLETEASRHEYDMIHFNRESLQGSKVSHYSNERARALSEQANMHYSAKVNEDIQRSRGRNGVVVLEAYYGALEDFTDPNTIVSSVAFGEILDVRIPLTSMMVNGMLDYRNTDPSSTQSMSSLPGFYDVSVGQPKRLYVKYSFRGKIHMFNISDGEDFVYPLARHAVQERMSKKSGVNSSRNYDIIVNSKPKPFIRLRYIVYGLGFYLFCRLSYSYIPIVHSSVDHVSQSYSQGTLLHDANIFCQNSIAAMTSLWERLIEYFRTSQTEMQ